MAVVVAAAAAEGDGPVHLSAASPEACRPSPACPMPGPEAGGRAADRAVEPLSVAGVTGPGSACRRIGPLLRAAKADGERGRGQVVTLKGGAGKGKRKGGRAGSDDEEGGGGAEEGESGAKKKGRRKKAKEAADGGEEVRPAARRARRRRAMSLAAGHASVVSVWAAGRRPDPPRAPGARLRAGDPVERKVEIRRHAAVLSLKPP